MLSVLGEEVKGMMTIGWVVKMDSHPSAYHVSHEKNG